MPTLVTLATYEQSKTACFIKEKFEAENIDCFFAIISTNEGEWEEARVQVKEYDVEKAIRVMLRIKDEYGMDIEEIDASDIPGKIIVPTNFSKGSEYACQYAVHLAHKIHAEIKLLHVYRDPAGEVRIKESASYLHYLNSTIRETERRAQDDMVDFSEKMRGYMRSEGIDNVKIHSALAMGDIIGGIRGVTRKYKPDLIVLGTEGRKEDSQSVLAGLTHAIISDLAVPVYAIPGPSSPEDFNKVRILYATDFNERDHNSLERLLKIVDPFETDITCVHIDTARNPAKKERMDELNLELKIEYGQHAITCKLIEDEDVFHGLKVFASGNNINLLSFTVHKRGIFEKLFKPNLFRKILQESNLPILLFPS